MRKLELGDILIYRDIFNRVILLRMCSLHKILKKLFRFLENIVFERIYLKLFPESNRNLIRYKSKYLCINHWTKKLRALLGLCAHSICARGDIYSSGLWTVNITVICCFYCIYRDIIEYRGNFLDIIVRFFF